MTSDKLPAQLYESIAAADIVSFDVFDTLLCRPVLKPVDVFELTRTTVEEDGRYFLPLNWTEARIAAEARCYTDSSVGPDVTLDDIYARLAVELDLPADVADAAKAAEIETELRLLRRRPQGFACFEAAKSTGARIFIVSDMYLPPSVIADALHAAGYDGWERLIVSGHDKIAKYDGTAYRSIRAEFPHDQIVHLGDNLGADVQRAEQSGIKAHHIPTFFSTVDWNASALPEPAFAALLRNPAHGRTELGLSIVAGLTSERFDRRGRGHAYEIGYSVLGPVVVAFSQWLHRAASAAGATKLAFLAREGRFMQRAYERYFADSALPTEYVYASRRMINFAGIRDAVTSAQLDFLVSSGVPLSVRDFVARFSPTIPATEIERAAASVGLRSDDVLSGHESAEMRSVFRALEPALVDVAHRERDNVIGYLKSIGLHRNGAAVVDIGWQGSIQASMTKLVNPSLTGFYFGVFDTPKTQGLAAMTGFVDARRGGTDLRWVEQCVLHGIEVIELLFGNDEHGSVSTVRRVDGRYEPSFTGETLNAADAAVIRGIQAAALDFVDDFRASQHALPATLQRIAPGTALTLLAALVRQPTAAQAALLGALNHDNSLGVVSSPLGMPRQPKSFYRRRPEQLRKELNEAWWKDGFVANARADGMPI